MREPNIGRHAQVDPRASLISVTVRRSGLHDGRCTDESCVRTARRSRASAGAILCGCIVARARRRALLDVSPNMRHVPPDLIRLKPLHRHLLYGVFALLFFSGAAWAYWNYLVSSPGDFEMSAKAWAMKIHGAAAMAILVLVGMLLDRSRALRLARASESWQRVAVSWRVRYSDRHWIRPLLRRR